MQVSPGVPKIMEGVRKYEELVLKTSRAGKLVFRVRVPGLPPKLSLIVFVYYSDKEHVNQVAEWLKAPLMKGGEIENIFGGSNPSLMIMFAKIYG